MARGRGGHTFAAGKNELAGLFGHPCDKRRVDLAHGGLLGTKAAADAGLADADHTLGNVQGVCQNAAAVENNLRRAEDIQTAVGINGAVGYERLHHILLYGLGMRSLVDNNIAFRQNLINLAILDNLMGAQVALIVGANRAVSLPGILRMHKHRVIQCSTEVKHCVQQLIFYFNQRQRLVNSHNAAIDAVLNQKGYMGKKQGIDMRFRVNDLSALRLPRVDVTIVLGNLIDNAMEACAGLSDPNRWVSIQILYSENMLSILIINPSNIVQINDGHIPTTKQDPSLHGFGIGNVKDILEKYHAEYLFTYDDGRFIFSADWPDIAEPSVNTSIFS